MNDNFIVKELSVSRSRSSRISAIWNQMSQSRIRDQRKSPRYCRPRWHTIRDVTMHTFKCFEVENQSNWFSFCRKLHFALCVWLYDFETLLPIVIARTASLLKMMKAGAISNNHLSVVNGGENLCEIVAIDTSTKVLGQPNRRPWWSRENPESNR